jgi:hypothetical protein
LALVATEPLTFDLLDDLLLARERGRRIDLRLAPGVCLGSTVELFSHLHASPTAFDHEPSAEIEAMRQALITRKPTYLSSQSVGISPARRVAVNGADTYWDQFLFALHKAIVANGFPASFSTGLVGALDEMQNNIHDHSAAPETGIIAYRVTQGRVEWSVSDRGVGIMAGLQRGQFPSVKDGGEALRLALTDGYSRLPVRGRGHGFRHLFKALSSRRGTLRFRSDDHVLTMTGVSPTLSRAKLQQRSRIAGFSVTVVCTNPRSA